MSYTKGHWAVSNSGGKVIVGGMKHPTTIATLETVPLKISPEIEANARLIAAAPYLYETAKEFTAGWEHFCKCITWKDSNLDAEAIRFMNEVPAKIATGIVKAVKGV
ncbi:hypothetical protein LCGC14_0580770 [marine sediment metagenome]|uniref:Uncharacterized protein n=1 Tax=marine sediment metagenome TaxID=412755 RepID=A0A0F9RGH1_9ZZZZ